MQPNLRCDNSDLRQLFAANAAAVGKHGTTAASAGTFQESATASPAAF